MLRCLANYRGLLVLFNSLFLTSVVYGSNSESIEDILSDNESHHTGYFCNPISRFADKEFSGSDCESLDSGDGPLFLSQEEFEKRKADYSDVFKATDHLPHFQAEAVTSWPPAEAGEPITFIPVPERCALICPREQGKIVRLETAGLYACVGIAGWNSKYIGLVHWDDVPEKTCLQRFLEEITLGCTLGEESTFLLRTNYLSSRLLDAHEMIRRIVPKAKILLEAEHDFGGFVISDKEHRDVYLIDDKDRHFVPGTNELKTFRWGKSLSIATYSNSGLLYSFSATEPADRVQDYFMYLDAPLYEEDEYQSPKAYWQSNFPKALLNEPELTWVIATKLYETYMKFYKDNGPEAQIFGDKKQPLIYLECNL